jgi:hypothetical protein
MEKRQGAWSLSDAARLTRMRAWGKAFGLVVVSALGACSGSSAPEGGVIVSMHEKRAAIFGNKLKDVQVTNLKCDPVGTAWGCSYSIRGVEVLRNGREVPFEHKDGTIKLERRGELWDLAL